MTSSERKRRRPELSISPLRRSTLSIRESVRTRLYVISAKEPLAEAQRFQGQGTKSGQGCHPIVVISAEGLLAECA